METNIDKKEKKWCYNSPYKWNDGIDFVVCMEVERQGFLFSVLVWVHWRFRLVYICQSL